jgi:hypothetical protein
MTKKKTEAASALSAEPCVVNPDGSLSDRGLWDDFLEEDARPHPWDTTCAEQDIAHARSGVPTKPSAPPTPRHRKARR